MPVSRDLTRIELSVLLIAIPIAASLWVLRPFLLATVWATWAVPISSRLPIWASCTDAHSRFDLS